MGHCTTFILLLVLEVPHTLYQHVAYLPVVLESYPELFTLLSIHRIVCKYNVLGLIVKLVFYKHCKYDCEDCS